MISSHTSLRSCLFSCGYFRVEIGKEDDLSPETDSDAMDVDTISHDGDDKHATKTAMGNGGGCVVKGGGFIVPEPVPEYAVSGDGACCPALVLKG